MTSPDDSRFDLFVSYAHADDGDGWVRELVEVVRGVQGRIEGAEPWRVFLDGPGIRLMDDWEKRIRTAAGSAGVMLALISPAYFRSEWCRREWEEFCKQERRRGEPRNRIMVLQLENEADFDRSDPTDEWRKDLKRRQYLDVRGWRGRRLTTLPHGAGDPLFRVVWDANKCLVRLCEAERLRLGVPWQALPLPPHYVHRPAEEGRLLDALLRPDGSGGVVVSAVFGQGGVGKTALAAAVVQMAEVRGRFDGLLSVTLGQQPEVRGVLDRWLTALGEPSTPTASIHDLSSRLRQVLQDRAVLLLVDDAWSSEAVEPFRVGGPRCGMLITTRRANIAENLGAIPQELDVLEPGQALQVLTEWLQRPLGGEEREPAGRVAEAVGRLPLALELASKRIARGISWEELVRALEQEVAALEKLEDPGDRRRGKARLEASFNLSLRALRADDEAAWEAFVRLGMLPGDATLAAPMAAMLWDLADASEANDLLEYLRGEALLQPVPKIRVGAEVWHAYRVHDLLHDHARRLMTTARESSRPGSLPGLGLALPEAHRELLQRYRRRTRDGLWHTLPADGYIHSRLAWHLEQAGEADGLHGLLREETPEGRNGWHETNERLGELASYADDISRAWRHADETFRGGAACALRLQCRYALVTASLNSLAKNIPPVLLASLVRHGQWPARLALAYARQTPEPGQKVEGIIALVPFLSAGQKEAALAEALRGARALRYEDERTSALAALAPHLPPPLLAEALRTARAVRDEGARAEALAALAPHLRAGEKEAALAEALRAARAARDERARSKALAALAPHLSPPLLAEALEAARALQHEGHSAEALAALAPQLPAGQKEAALAEALEAARAVQDEGDRAEALAALAPHLRAGEKEAVLGEALRAARAPQYDGARSKALAALAPQLSPSLLAEALQAARAVRDEGFRVRALAALVSQLPAGQKEAALAEALQAARALEYEDDRTWALAALAPHLSAPLLAEALRAARAHPYEDERTSALAALAPHLPPPLLAEALRVGRAVRDEGARAEALAALAPHLPGGEKEAALAEALRAARAARDERARSKALVALAPHLPGGEKEAALAEALRAARAVPDDGFRSEALAALAPQLPAGLKEAALAEALEAARAVQNERYRSRAPAALAPHPRAAANEAALAEALQAARAVPYDGARSRALAALAPQLALLPHARLSSLWSVTLPLLASRTRMDLFADLRDLAPVLAALAGTNASVEFQEIATAISDVRRWWP